MSNTRHKTKENLQRIKHQFIEIMGESGQDIEQINPDPTVVSSSAKITARLILKCLDEMIESFPEERFYINGKHKWHLIDNKNNEQYFPYTFNDSTQNNLKEICDLLNAGDKALNKESAPQPKSK